MIEWRNLYRGLIMGSSDVVPGVSGGTMAVLLGIYERFIEALNGILSKEWKKHIGFLLPLAIGIVIAMVSLAEVINWAFENYPNQTLFLFLGLIAGVIPFLAHKSNYKETFKGTHYFLLILAAILVGSMALFGDGPAETEPITSFSTDTYIKLFFSGWLASSAMILPGISGSFLLLLVGMYSTFTHALGNFIFEALIPLGLGIVLGLLIMSKILRYLFDRYYYQTYALVIGLVVGSLAVVYPGLESDMMLNVLSAITFIIGLLAAYGLGRLEY
ncbi:DUF368 domain-containing protein [Filobacillus milosensis]|uniref:DUF368 domain-containing protein n=1 Tax=Filobacillus milosensis TaxID=94137 RepID=A0A4Y8ISG4_9BACI|nr:DUF368 domain-containing protein [Filobacillus milosensis]TFB21717.1 DUF368 domain-containing protein [Filobacillus milosensis]